MGVGVIPLVFSRIFPACGKSGAAGATPGIVDFGKLHLPKAPNKTLALVDKVAAAQPRIYSPESYTEAGQAAWVARSKIANVPDIIEAAAAPAADGSTPILYSHSIYGRGDFGVNKARMQIWLAAIGQLVEESEMERAQ